MNTSRKTLLVSALTLATAGNVSGQETRKIAGGGGLNVGVYEAGNPAGPRSPG
jgi:hypothetical protein